MPGSAGTLLTFGSGRQEKKNDLITRMIERTLTQKKERPKVAGDTSQKPAEEIRKGATSLEAGRPSANQAIRTK